MVLAGQLLKECGSVVLNVQQLEGQKTPGGAGKNKEAYDLEFHSLFFKDTLEQK